MKIRYLYPLFSGLLLISLFLANSSGPGSVGTGARTGAPGEGICSNCHGGSGGTFSPSINIQVLDGATAVSTYQAGRSYTLRVQISSANSTCFGAQATVLNSSNSNTGSLSSPGSGVRVLTIGSRTYIEHTQRSSSGVFTATWTAPAAGTGTVTVYAAGIACNNSSGSSGDNTISGTLSLSEAPSTQISYNQTSFCRNAGTNPLATIQGTTGGSFSASPTGLSLNSSTGEINLSASSPGTYTITYTFTGGTASTSINLSNRATVGLTYPQSSLCGGDLSAPLPQISGASGGRFFASPSGLALDSVTGAINPSVSQPGNYTLSYRSLGACPDTASVSLSITAPIVAELSYAAASFCQLNANPSPTSLSPSGGQLSSSPSGLDFDSNSGLINLSNSNPGTYQLVYLPNGSCVQADTFVLSVTASGDARFEYAQTAYCQDDTLSPLPNILGQTGGSFRSEPAGLVLDNLGEINLSQSSVGQYQIIYELAGTCPASDTFSLEIQPACLVTSLALSSAKADRLYPNPSSGRIYLELGETPSSDLELEILDQLGRRMSLQKLSPAGLYELELPQNQGFYLLRWRVEGGSSQSRLIRRD